MSKIKAFFMDLSKSTKITMISCGCFVLLTLLILVFFVMFPITPSDRAIAKFGGEGLVYNDGESTGTTTSTTVTDITVTTTAVQTTTTMKSEATVTFTTMSGYLSGGYIRTGEYDPYGDSTVTTPAEPSDYDPGYNYDPEQPSTDYPVEPATDAPTEPEPDITTSPQPTTQDVIEPTEPPVEPTDPPVVDTTPPPDPTDPPAESPDDPPQL